MKRGGHGWGWDIALGLAGSIFQSRWVFPGPSIIVVTMVAAVGAAGLIVAQRTIWPATV